MEFVLIGKSNIWGGGGYMPLGSCTYELMATTGKHDQHLHYLSFVNNRELKKRKGSMKIGAMSLPVISKQTYV